MNSSYIDISNTVCLIQFYDMAKNFTVKSTDALYLDFYHFTNGADRFYRPPLFSRYLTMLLRCNVALSTFNVIYHSSKPNGLHFVLFLMSAFRCAANAVPLTDFHEAFAMLTEHLFFNICD